MLRWPGWRLIKELEHKRLNSRVGRNSTLWCPGVTKIFYSLLVGQDFNIIHNLLLPPVRAELCSTLIRWLWVREGGTGESIGGGAENRNLSTFIGGRQARMCICVARALGSRRVASALCVTKDFYWKTLLFLSQWVQVSFIHVYVALNPTHKVSNKWKSPKRGRGQIWVPVEDSI